METLERELPAEQLVIRREVESFVKGHCEYKPLDKQVLFAINLANWERIIRRCRSVRAVDELRKQLDLEAQAGIYDSRSAAQIQRRLDEYTPHASVIRERRKASTTSRRPAGKSWRSKARPRTVPEQIAHLEDHDDPFLATLYYENRIMFGRDKLYDYLKREYPEKVRDEGYSEQYISRWLQRQPLAQVFAPAYNTVHLQRNRITTPHTQVAIDLVDMGSLRQTFVHAEHVASYRYILTAIDLGSKRAFAEPLTDKQPSTVLKAMHRIMYGKDLEIFQIKHGGQIETEASETLRISKYGRATKVAVAAKNALKARKLTTGYTLDDDLYGKYDLDGTTPPGDGIASKGQVFLAVYTAIRRALRHHNLLTASLGLVSLAEFERLPDAERKKTLERMHDTLREQLPVATLASTPVMTPYYWMESVEPTVPVRNHMISVPKSLRSDNGPEFKCVRDDCVWVSYRCGSRYGHHTRADGSLQELKQVFSEPHSPTSNGAIERFNKTIKRLLRMIKVASGNVNNWVGELQNAVQQYNDSTSSVTGLAPDEFEHHHHRKRGRTHVSGELGAQRLCDRTSAEKPAPVLDVILERAKRNAVTNTPTSSCKAKEAACVPATPCEPLPVGVKGCAKFDDSPPTSDDEGYAEVSRAPRRGATAVCTGPQCSLVPNPVPNTDAALARSKAVCRLAENMVEAQFKVGDVVRARDRRETRTSKIKPKLCGQNWSTELFVVYKVVKPTAGAKPDHGDPLRTPLERVRASAFQFVQYYIYPIAEDDDKWVGVRALRNNSKYRNKPTPIKLPPAVYAELKHQGSAPNKERLQEMAAAVLRDLKSTSWLFLTTEKALYHNELQRYIPVSSSARAVNERKLLAEVISHYPNDPDQPAHRLLVLWRKGNTTGTPSTFEWVTTHSIVDDWPKIWGIYSRAASKHEKAVRLPDEPEYTATRDGHGTVEVARPRISLEETLRIDVYDTNPAGRPRIQLNGRTLPVRQARRAIKHNDWGPLLQQPGAVTKVQAHKQRIVDTVSRVGLLGLAPTPLANGETPAAVFNEQSNQTLALATLLPSWRATELYTQVQMTLHMHADTDDASAYLVVHLRDIQQIVAAKVPRDQEVIDHTLKALSDRVEEDADVSTWLTSSPDGKHEGGPVVVITTSAAHRGGILVHYRPSAAASSS